MIDIRPTRMTSTRSSTARSTTDQPTTARSTTVELACLMAGNPQQPLRKMRAYEYEILYVL